MKQIDALMLRRRSADSRVLAGAVKTESRDTIVAVPLWERGAPKVVFKVEVHPTGHLWLHVVVAEQPPWGLVV